MLKNFENFSKVIIFEEMILQEQKFSTKIINQNNGKFGLVLWFRLVFPNRNIPLKKFHEQFFKNFSKVIIFEEMILQQQKIFDQNY